MEVVTYGCVTSVEAGGEATEVNIGVLICLRCKVVTYGCGSLWRLDGRPQESILVVWHAYDLKLFPIVV